jgi:hypothetical protein
MSELRKNLGEVKREMRERNKLLRRIERCIDEAVLNDWEEDFLDSIYDQVDSGAYAEGGGVLSEAQLAKLAEIEDIVEGGRNDG